MPRQTKLFDIKVNNVEAANVLKEKLKDFKIDEIEQDVNMSYSGYISCDIVEIDRKVIVTIHTFLEKVEFEDIVFECCETADFFQYDRPYIQ